MAFTEIGTVRNITGFSSTDYSDGKIQDFISMAQREVIANIQQKVVREYVSYLDSTRTNDIDGVNQTFYLKNWKGNYLGDMDYDGDIDETDIIIYQVDSDGTETLLTPSVVNSSNMSFTLSSAPSSDVDLYVTYTYSNYDMENPDPFLSQLTAYLTASYMDITESGGSGGSESVRIGNLSISEGSSSSGLSGNKYYQKYMELLNKLIEHSTGGAIWGESLVRI